MKKKKAIKSSPLDITLKVINYTLLVFIAFTMLYPFWDILVKSFMTDVDIIRSKFVLWPKNWQFKGYETIFKDRTYNFGRAFLNSVFVTVTDTVYQLAITALAAYALTKRRCPAESFSSSTSCLRCTSAAADTLLYRHKKFKSIKLHMGADNPVVHKHIQHACNEVVFRRNTRRASRRGAYRRRGDFRTFLVIVLPLSKAVLATIALFIAVGVWNNWFSTMLFIQDATKRPMAYALQIIIEKSRGANTDVGTGVGQVIIGQSVQYAAIVVAVFPIMAIYPFLQKHFTKGVLIPGR